jgi:hypothetical protein
LPGPLPTDLVIILKKSAHGGRHVARAAEGPDSEMTFQHRALLDRALNDARAFGLKIIPRRNSSVAQAARHPDWSDVIQVV